MYQYSGVLFAVRLAISNCPRPAQFATVSHEAGLRRSTFTLNKFPGVKLIENCCGNVETIF